MMKKTLKVLISAIAVFAIVLSVAAVPVSAAADTVLNFKTKVTVGDTVDVKVTLSVAKMYGVNINVNYDASVLSYVSGATQGGAGVVQIVDENVGGSSKTGYTLKFKAKKAGSSLISVSGQVGAGIPATDVDLRGASATITVEDEKLSANANLSSLSVSNGSLSPRFSASKTSYTVDVKKSVTECKVYATAEESGAEVSVSGSPTLKIGKNTRTVTVTAPSGAQKVYTLTINRSDVDEETSSETDPTETNPLETIVDGVSYKVLPNISKIKLPKGFNTTKKVYNNETITVAKDRNGNFEIYYLKPLNGGVAVPYTYDELLNTFTKVDIITQGENKYILVPFPEGKVAPDGYYSANVTIDENEIKCYASTSAELTDMYYIYCFHNNRYAMYRYDKVEGVLQRSPEFRMVDAETEETLATSTDVEDGGFLDRFNSLSSNAKTIVVGIAILIIGIIILIVLLIIKFTSRKGDFDQNQQNETEDFDNVSFGDDFEIISGEEDEDDNF